MKLTLERIEELRRQAERTYPHALGLTSKDELLSLLGSARALARLEVWLRADAHRYVEYADETNVEITNGKTWWGGSGPDLAAAIHKALDGAEAGR